MALNLVSYDSSDNESGNEMEVGESSQSKVEIVKKVNVTRNMTVNEDIGDVPKPSDKELELAEMARKEKANLPKVGLLSQVTQKKNGKVIIGIPSLSEFDEEDEDEDEAKKSKKKPITPSQGHSKLFARLPQPRNSSYVPASEEPKPINTPAPAVKKSTPLIPQSVAKKVTKKDSDDEEDTGGFFTLDEPAIQPPAGLFKAVEPTSMASEVPSYESAEASCYSLPTNQQYNLANIDVQVAKPAEDIELDETALQALQGVKRKLPDDAQVIEVRGERLTYDPSLSYLKSISEERGPSSEGTQFNKVQKKRHQITYLAAQAKAREVELKNQWAQNKVSRRQTQQKYGF